MTLKASLISKLGYEGSIVQASGIGGRYVRVRANGADLFIGAAVTIYGETASDPDVDLCATGEVPSGYITGPADDALDLDKDADDAYADNTYLMMYVPAQGDRLLLCANTDTSLAVTRGGPVYALAGFVQDATIGTNHVIGQFQDAEAAGTTQTVYVWVTMV